MVFRPKDDAYIYI